jgi:hypothetical protein
LTDSKPVSSELRVRWINISAITTRSIELGTSGWRTRRTIESDRCTAPDSRAKKRE